MLENQRVLQIPIISSRNLQHKHKHHPSYYWIPNREASSPHGYFPIRRPRTEGPTQTVFSPWLLMMDPDLPLRSRCCRTRGATAIAGLGLASLAECVLGYILLHWGQWTLKRKAVPAGSFQRTKYFLAFEELPGKGT